MTDDHRMPVPPARPPDFFDDFSHSVDSARWVADYLPHWTTPDRSAARYRIVESGVELRIDSDQPDWRAEDAPLRVSNLQSGAYSGPIGSTIGTHRHRPDGLVVRTPTPVALLFAPSAGRVDVTVSASRNEGCMTAAWLVGTEHLSADDAGEICVFEIDFDAITGAVSRARSGIKAHHDPRLTTDMGEASIPIDAGSPHTWTVIWSSGETLIGCEGLVVRRLSQSPAYPMFLMIDLFEIAPPAGDYPKTAIIHEVKGWATGP